MDYSWDFSYSFAVFILFLTLFVLYFTRIISRKCIPEYIMGTSQNTSTCASPNCIRCAQKSLRDSKVFDHKVADFLAENKHYNSTCLDRIKKAVIGDSLNDLRVSRQKPTTFFVPELCSMPWYRTNQMGCDNFLNSLVDVESQKKMKKEFLQVFQHLDEGWFKNSTPEGGWFVFPLYNQGVMVAENCKKCPQTVKLIDTTKLFMRCAFGNALFSVLQPGTHIAPHYGPTNCRIRCHVPLIVPQGCCGIDVDGVKRHWEEGKLMLFDDSFLHVACHNGCTSIGPRVVLMLDLWHPDLTDEEKKAVIHLFPAPS